MLNFIVSLSVSHCTVSQDSWLWVRFAPGVSQTWMLGTEEGGITPKQEQLKWQ